MKINKMKMTFGLVLLSSSNCLNVQSIIQGTKQELLSPDGAYPFTFYQRWSTWLHEAVRKCAEYGMMVDIHDKYRPTGFSHTYPNLMTQKKVEAGDKLLLNLKASGGVAMRFVLIEK